MNEYHRNRSCYCPRCRSAGYIGPIVLIALGVLFLIDQYTMYSIGRTWPVILIVIGVAKLLQWNAPTTGHMEISQLGPGAPPPGTPSGGGTEPSSDESQVTHG
jgi:hypothetical protein